MKITDMIKELEKVKEKFGDLSIQTGVQGEESFRDFDFDKDCYIWGIFGDTIGLVINENSRNVAVEKKEKSYEEFRKYVKETGMKFPSMEECPDEFLELNSHFRKVAGIKDEYN